METQVQTMARAQRDKWEILGCKPIYSRGTVRLPNMMKSFLPDLNVTVRDPETNEWVPFLLRSGRPLKCSEVLPERADLCLDEEGHLLNQMEFERNYMQYLETFVLPPGADITAEPVPNVRTYINRKPDQWGESSGMVEIDYEPHIEKEFKPLKRFGPNGEPEEEYLAKHSNQSADIMSILSKLADGQSILAQLVGGNKIEPEAVDGVKSEGVIGSKVDTAPEGKERMPCGDWITAGYTKQHQRFCKHENCGGGDEAA